MSLEPGAAEPHPEPDLPARPGRAGPGHVERLPRLPAQDPRRAQSREREVRHPRGDPGQDLLPRLARPRDPLRLPAACRGRIPRERLRVHTALLEHAAPPVDDAKHVHVGRLRLARVRQPRRSTALLAAAALPDRQSRWPETRLRRLDIGCGSSRIIQSHPESVGLDIELSKLRFLRRTNQRLVRSSCFRLPFADHSFSTVVNSQLIEHVPYDRSLCSPS